MGACQVEVQLVSYLSCLLAMYILYLRHYHSKQSSSTRHSPVACLHKLVSGHVQNSCGVVARLANAQPCPHCLFDVRARAVSPLAAVFLQDFLCSLPLCFFFSFLTFVCILRTGNAHTMC